METTKFIHIGDTHLGYKQYNKIERYNDFKNAFQWILDKALKEKVDFILHTGDFFDNSKLNPSTLSDVYYILSNFKDKSEKELGRVIPIIAIEGNHDKPLFSKQSWMSFLADLDLIVLLNGKYSNEHKKISFQEFSSETKRGGKLKIKNINIYGLPYFGSITPKLFPMIDESLPNNKNSFNILMMHFGMAGQDKEKKGLNLDEDFEKIHNKINYLALGHFHNMYRLPLGDEWIFNPGSTEINDFGQLFDVQKNDFDHGAFLVEVYDDQISQPRILELHCHLGETDDPNYIPNRNFVNIGNVDIGEKSLVNFELAEKAVFNRIRRSGIYYKKDNNYNKETELNRPLIALSLTGTIPYSKMQVNTRELKEKILEEFDILDVRIYTTFLESELDGISIQRDDKLTVAEIEKIVFRNLIDKNELYALKSDSVLHLMLDFKEQVLKSDSNSADIADLLKDFYKKNFENVDIDALKKIEEKDKSISKSEKKPNNSKKISKKKTKSKKKAKTQATFDQIMNRVVKVSEEINNENKDVEDSDDDKDEEIEVLEKLESEDLGNMSEEDLFDDGEDDFD